jgi:hypothetical protein
LHGLPWIGKPTGTRLPSTHAPANDCSFDAAACIHALPSAAAPSAQEGNDIRADVILAKKLKGLVRRRLAFVTEGADSLLPCRHAILIFRAVTTSMQTRRCDGIAACLYNAVKDGINQRGSHGIQAKLRKRSS